MIQLDNQGGQPYWSWYGFNSRVEWCACFVSWCADQCGYIESGLVPKFAGCVDGANWFKSNRKWQDRTYEPKAGDIIFFDWEGDGTTDHVGIVEKCENGTVYTVEGNSGDACKQRQYTVGSSNIYGYGYSGILKIPDGVWKIEKMAARLSSHRVHYEKSVVSLSFRKI